MVVIFLQVCEDFDGEEHRHVDVVDSDADGHIEVVCDGGVSVAGFLLQRGFQVDEGFFGENPAHAAADSVNAYLVMLVLDCGDVVHGGCSHRSMRNLLLRI